MRRRKAVEPMAYIRGYQEFMGTPFSGRPPRPHTASRDGDTGRGGNRRTANGHEKYEQRGPCGRCEQRRLHWQCQRHWHNVFTIADICCGSGAIGLSLAKELPGVDVILTDVSPDALEVARKNVALLGVERQARFLEGDLVAPLVDARLSDSLDLVTANPPILRRRRWTCTPRCAVLRAPSGAGRWPRGTGLHQASGG